MEDEAFTRASSSVLRHSSFVVEGIMLLNQSVWWIVPYAVLMLLMPGVVSVWDRCIRGK